MYEMAKQLIKNFEGLYLHAYYCPAGILTIGYGHVVKANEPKTITKEQAELYLDADIKKAVSALRMVKVPINEKQQSALISFIFNLGAGALATSTLLRLLNKNDYAGAANQFGRWIKAKGKTLPGLVRRREAERKLFVS